MTDSFGQCPGPTRGTDERKDKRGGPHRAREEWKDRRNIGEDFASQGIICSGLKTQ